MLNKIDQQYFQFSLKSKRKEAETLLTKKP